MTPSFLIRVLSYTPLSRGTRVGPEDSECVAFANALRAYTLEGFLRAVFVHPAQELCFGHKNGVRAAISRAMGMHVGVSDYLFLWGSGSLAIEFKTKTGRQTQGQSDFEAYCIMMNVPYRIARSCAEGLAIVREYGILD